MIELLLPKIGLTFLLTQAKIFKPLREQLTRFDVKIGELVSCEQCLSVWICAVWTLFDHRWMDIFTVSFLCYALAIILNKIKR